MFRGSLGECPWEVWWECPGESRENVRGKSWEMSEESGGNVRGKSGGMSVYPVSESLNIIVYL